MHYLRYLVCLLLCSLGLHVSGQALFSENFESGALPSNWEVQTLATDGGWRVGNSQSLSSGYFPIQSNNSSFFAGTNDDQCNCNKSNDRLISPSIDLRSVQAAVLSFDAFYIDSGYQGLFEDARVQVSTDKNSWVDVYDLKGNASWQTHFVNLTDYAGQAEIYISFLYNDGGGWLFGFALDNISVNVPEALDVELDKISSTSYAETGNPINIEGVINNNGAETIQQLEMAYAINGMVEATEQFDNVNIQALESEPFRFTEAWIPEMTGNFTVEVSIVSVNGQADVDASDNNLSFSVEILEKLERKNIIQDILNSSPDIQTIADASNQLNRPTDLDFFPILGKDELWVVNQRTESDGGSTLTISNASSNPDNMWLRVDGNAWHFMSLPTGIAFSDDNYNFAVSPGVLDANHSGGTFTGPALFSSDPAIYAQPSGGNGSHLDMLHGSPYSMGIAHDNGNAFWIYDNYNKDIVYYDFVEDHGPGNDDHSDGIVRRYSNMGINADTDIPNHMILDKNSGWLYFVDNGNDRVVRLNTNSGSSTTPLALINEQLAEHSRVNGYTWEVIIEGLDRPCGIELIDNILLIGEYNTGEIIAYDMNSDFSEVGRIETAAVGLTGIKVGPDGSVWYTNRILNKLNKIQVGETTSTEDILFGTQISVWPNPSSEHLIIDFSKNQLDTEKYISILDLSGKLLFRQTVKGDRASIDVSGFNTGGYLLRLRSNGLSTTKKILIDN
jgi:hypothetical protein